MRVGLPSMPNAVYSSASGAPYARGASFLGWGIDEHSMGRSVCAWGFQPEPLNYYGGKRALRMRVGLPHLIWR